MTRSSGNNIYKHFLTVIIFLLIFGTNGLSQTDTLNISWNLNPPADTVQYYLLYRVLCNSLSDTSQQGTILDTVYESSGTVVGNRIHYTDLDRNLINPGALISYRARAVNIHGFSPISAHAHAGIPEIIWSDTHIDSGRTTAFPFSSFLTDLDDDPSQLSLETAQATNVSLQIQNYQLLVTPDPLTYTGSASFELTVSDSDSYWDRSLVTLIIDTSLTQNNNPVAVDDTASTTEGNAINIDVLANDFDPDGDSLIVSDIIQDPAHGSAVINQLTRVVYTPQSSYIGDDSFRYEIYDGSGGRDTATVYVSIIAVPPVNNSPIARDDSAKVTQGEEVIISVLINDEDPDGDVLAVSAIVSNAFHGPTVINSGITVTYTPQVSYTGSDSFQYEIHDGRGGRDTASVYLTISSIPNDRPIANDDSANTTEGDAVTINVLFNDEDPDGDQLTVSSIVSNALHGSMIINSGITVTYTPQSGYSGLDSFRYEIHDGRGGRDTASVYLNISSLPNNRPIANDDSVTIQEPLPVTIDVLDNDMDPDGDQIAVSNIVTLPTFGLAGINQGRNITYSPGYSFVDFDQFQYEIYDGRGGRDTAMVRIILFATESISENLRAFPNPYRPSSGYDHLVFEPLPTDAREIVIVSTAGKLVYEETLDPTQSRRWEWNVKNKSQQEVASGLYIYVIKGSGGDKIASGKIAIIR